MRRLLLLLALVLALPAAAQDGFAFIVPPADGRGDTSANDLSDDGSVVVGGYSAETTGRAFRWTLGGGAEALVEASAAFQPRSAYGVSADGSVIVGNGSDGGGREAFRWTASGGVERLATLPGSTNNSAVGVSDDGAVIVGSGLVSSRNRAIVWTDGVPEDLGLFGTFNECFATAVSADGAVVVGACSRFTTGVGTRAEPFRWTRAEGMVGLGDLDPTASVPSGSATGVSADGTVVVGSGGNSSDSQQMRWTAETGVEGLPFAFIYTGRARALGVSADGRVVGGYDFANSSAPTGVVWTAATGTVSIYDVVTSPLSPPGGLLSDVQALSGDGSVVVGNSVRFDGEPSQAWVAEVRLPTASDAAPDDGLALSVAPNPAAGRATVALTLPVAGEARVEAFDVLGRRMAVLHEGTLAAGAHRLALVASALPAGIVIVRAVTEAGVVSQTVTVVR